MEDIVTPTNSDNEREECDTPTFGRSPLHSRPPHAHHPPHSHTHHPPHSHSHHPPHSHKVNGYPEVKILSQPPPSHPAPAQNGSHSHSSSSQQRRALQDRCASGEFTLAQLNQSSNSVMPIIKSAPPPRKFSLGNVSSSSTFSIDEVDDTDLGEGVGGHTVGVRFEVTVRSEGVREGEEVRITGNAAALGKWNVLNSVKLHKSTEQDDRWWVELEVPTEFPIKFRYMITKDTGGEECGFRIVSWETFLVPRAHTFRRPKSASEAIHTLQGEYGVSEGGRGRTDPGWLVSTSELHIQLGTLGSSLAIDDQPTDTQYLIRVEPFSTKSGKTVECSPVVTKLQNRTSGDCVTFDIRDGACPYDQQTNVLVFTTESHDFQTTGFCFDVYTYQDPATPTFPVPLPSPSSKVGRASLHPRQYLCKDSRGGVVLTLFSPELLPVGALTLSFLVIHPTRDTPLLHSAKHSYSNYWKRHKRMLHIGHRGLGDSYHTELKPTVTENTISSLKMAGNHGADYVEFDVQLTRDHVPIVYHNFQVCTTLAREGYFSGELYAMQVKDLTLHQLQSLKLDHSSIIKKLSTSESSSNSSSDYESSNETYWGAKRGGAYRGELPEKKTFPTLTKLFTSLPGHIGFDIEVKYPLPERDEEGQVQEDFPAFDCNLFADALLKVVYRHARGRKVMFTCFNPDMCTILRRKQPKYPVLFLTSGLCPLWGVPLDVRGRTVQEAIMHVHAEQLLGVVSNSYPLLRDHQLIKVVKERELVLFTWGEENNNLKSIETQSKAGVDAVIYDSIHTLLKPRKNIFQLEAEEEEGLQEGDHSDDDSQTIR